MAAYPQLPFLCANIVAGDPQQKLLSEVVPYLIDVWLSDYCRACSSTDIVETKASSFSYLFDIGPGRLISAWGLSQGKNHSPRPAGRMAGHPLGGDQHYHRGHAIAHTLGGATDINLVPQLGAVNVGPFRELERMAVATPGALYFTYWSYRAKDTQRPAAVDQGLIVPGQFPRLKTLPN
jgi:hypothetical protein